MGVIVAGILMLLFLLCVLWYCYCCFVVSDIAINYKYQDIISVSVILLSLLPLLLLGLFGCYRRCHRVILIDTVVDGVVIPMLLILLLTSLFC